MGNESCCTANSDNQEGKVTSVDDMIAKRQLARAPVPILAEKSALDYKSADRELQQASIASSSPLEDRPDVKLADGSVYKGQWRGELKEGRGTLTYPDGAVYEGNSSFIKASS